MTTTPSTIIEMTCAPAVSQRQPAMCESPEETTYSQSACTECQRRKQKVRIYVGSGLLNFNEFTISNMYRQCNREWPCNRCQKRKAADRCRFGHRKPGLDKVPSQDSCRKRQLSNYESSAWDDVGCGFVALGYTASHIFAGLDTNSVVCH